MSFYLYPFPLSFSLFANFPSPSTQMTAYKLVQRCLLKASLSIQLLPSASLLPLYYLQTTLICKVCLSFCCDLAL